MLFSSLNCYNFAFHIPANVIYLNLRHCLFIFPTFALSVILLHNLEFSQTLKCRRHKNVFI